MEKVAILGAGRWGITLSLILEEKGFFPILWDMNGEYLEEVEKKRKIFSNISIPTSIRFCKDLKEVLEETNILFFATPSSLLRKVALQIGKNGMRKMIICGTKGLEEETGARMSQIIKECIEREPVVISGPTHAEELVLKLPSAMVAASSNIEEAEKVQNMLSTPYLRIYTNTDIVGVEVCGALKNVIAIAAGICDGLSLGDNAKAALITRGLAEIKRFGLWMGAHPLTFMGLAGVGDLVVTCTSSWSRNRRFGELLAKGLSAIEAERRINETIEGIKTVLAVKRLSEYFSLELPICEKVYEVIYCGLAPKEALCALMRRPQKMEETQIIEVRR